MKDSRELQGDDVRDVFEAILPDDVLDSMIESTGFQERTRTGGLDAKLFLRSMVIAAASGSGGRQADIARAYFENGGARVSRAARYSWYDDALDQTMERIRDRAFAFGATLERDLPAFLDGLVRDIHIVDSMTVRLPDDLEDAYPAAGDYAALKVHKRFSVGIGTTIGYHLSPARDHDAPHLTIDESWRGLGLLVDLGYASRRLVRECETHGVLFVMRLKENWKPKVTRVVEGRVVAGFAAGTDLDLMLESDQLTLRADTPIDADVTIGRAGDRIACRLVAIAHEGAYFYYLTNAPRRVTPRQIADLYRVRWEIESDNKLDKSCMNLGHIKARKPESVRALVHASLVASMMVCFLAHRHRLREGHASARSRERTRPPIHPQSLGRMLAAMSIRVGTAMQLPPDEARPQWEFIAATLLHEGRDPNWRRNPSVLDQLRGWRTTPGTPRKGRAASLEHPAGPARRAPARAGAAK